MNKTIFLGLTVGVIVAMITSAAVSVLDYIVLGVQNLGCKSDFWSRTCCYLQEKQTPDGGTAVVRVCTTCLDNGDGTYRDCKTTKDSPEPTNKPTDPFTPGGPQIFDGGFQQDLDSSPVGPAAQDQPTGGSMPGPGIFQGNLLESYSQLGLVQSDPDSETPSETNTTQPGDIVQEDLGQLGATQDNETASEDDVTSEPAVPEENMTAAAPATEGTQVPSTEETQPALTQEEPVPTCPEGQVLDEETNLCVLKEPEAGEPEQEEQQELPQQEEENQESENNGSEGGSE